MWFINCPSRLRVWDFAGDHTDKEEDKNDGDSFDEEYLEEEDAEFSDSEDDEEIDSDEAFEGESDEEKFSSFKFREVSGI